MEIDTLATPEQAEVTSITDIKRKMHFTGTVLKTTLAGAVVNIGLETPGVVHISQLQKDPVNRVEDVIQVGQTVEVWVRRVDPNKGRIDLTMIKPLDLEWRDIDKDMIVKGKVMRLEKFGAFIDIGAERPGLVHISEMTHDYIKSPNDVVKEGDEVEVKVLGVNRRKKQIKLSMKALAEKPIRLPRPNPKDKREAMVQPIQPVQVPEEPVEKEEPVPTAMEQALRQAMKRAEDNHEPLDTQARRKTTPKNVERENIFSRTLDKKVKTVSK